MKKFDTITFLLPFNNKFIIMQKFLQEFIAFKKGEEDSATKQIDENIYIYNLKGLGNIYLLKVLDKKALAKISPERNLAYVIVCLENTLPDNMPNVSVFEIKSRRYIKQRTPIEIEFMKFIKGFRARFVPGIQPEIGKALRRQYAG